MESKMNKLLLLLIYFSLTIFSAAGQHDQIVQIEDLIDQQQYEKGLEIIDQVISKHPTNVVYYYKAYCEQQKKLFEAATVSASLALKITTKTDTLYTRILFLRSSCYANAGKLDLAIADNETLLKQFPNDLHYLLNKSYLYGENNQFDDCMKILRKALILDSSNIQILNNLSYYSNQSSKYGDAIKYSEKGLTLSNDSVSVASLLNSLGFAQAKSISIEKGLQTIKQSISYQPNNPYAFFNLGLIYLDKKEIEEACRNFKIARQLGGINMTAEYIKQYCN
jgi:tetratricopeptide (TPR) repeat protein